MQLRGMKQLYLTNVGPLLSKLINKYIIYRIKKLIRLIRVYENPLNLIVANIFTMHINLINYSLFFRSRQ